MPNEVGAVWCVYCRSPIPPEAAECPNCRKPMSDRTRVIRCPGCGKFTLKSDGVCRHCHSPLPQPAVRTVPEADAEAPAQTESAAEAAPPVSVPEESAAAPAAPEAEEAPQNPAPVAAEAPEAPTAAEEDAPAEAAAPEVPAAAEGDAPQAPPMAADPSPAPAGTSRRQTNIPYSHASAAENALRNMGTGVPRQAEFMRAPKGPAQNRGSAPRSPAAAAAAKARSKAVQRSKRMILLVILLLFAAVAVGGFFAGRSVGRQRSEEDARALADMEKAVRESYDLGYTEGFAAGNYDLGYQDGHREGYAEGHTAGYAEGFESGEAHGYSVGIKEGKNR